jgi:hypothetical protein
MPNNYKTGNSVHDAAMAAATSTWQAAVVLGATAATVRAADIAYARAAKASCVANNSSSGVEQYVTMLKELGTGGS